MELQVFDLVERNAYLEDEMNALHHELVETKNALSDACSAVYAGQWGQW